MLQCLRHGRAYYSNARWVKLVHRRVSVLLITERWCDRFFWQNGNSVMGMLQVHQQHNQLTWNILVSCPTPLHWYLLWRSGKVITHALTKSLMCKLHGVVLQANCISSMFSLSVFWQWFHPKIIICQESCQKASYIWYIISVSPFAIGYLYRLSRWSPYDSTFIALRKSLYMRFINDKIATTQCLAHLRPTMTYHE